MKTVVVALLYWLALALPAAAHPSHTSFAEIGWNQAGNSLEVSLRVIPEDLEAELSQRTGEAIALQDNPQQRELIKRWLSSQFIVSGVNQQPAQLTLVDMELGYDQTWLYFTIEANQGQRLQLANHILMAYNKERGRVQLNQIQRMWAPANDRMSFNNSDPQLIWEPQ